MPVLESFMQPTLRLRYERLVTCTELQKFLLCFSHVVEYCDTHFVYGFLDFAMTMHVLLLKNTKSVFPIEGFRLEVYLLIFTRQCVRLVVFQVLLFSLKGGWYTRKQVPCKVLGTLRTTTALGQVFM
jgi:hypothetical protein